MLLFFVFSQTATAQFYRQNNRTVDILNNGSSVSKGDTLRVESKRTVANKKKKSAVKKKKKSVVAKSDSAKARKSKNEVEYTGIKYRLGDRVIMRGDSGADVKSLANILVKRLFLDEHDIIYTKDGGVLYDGAIIKAVRSFQKVSGLYEDGMVGTPTLKALRKRKRY